MFCKNRFYMTFLALCAISMVSLADPLMMPENCLQNLKTPCLIKIKKNEQFEYKNLNFSAIQETVFKISDFKKMNMELVQGQIVADFKKLGAVLQVSELIFSKGPMYLERNGDKTIIISGENYKRIELDESQRPITVKTTVMDKLSFIAHLSKYYSNKQYFKSVLHQIFPVYLLTFKADVENQKQQLQRSIASVEHREEQERLKQAEIKAQRQINRDTFFQRTFKQ